jgi:hypothetical protein
VVTVKQSNAGFRDEAERRRAWLIGIGAWAVPGLGHLLLRRWLRALLAGGSVWMMFLVGLRLGGHLFSISSTSQGFSGILQGLPMILNLGLGFVYLVCWLTNTGFAEDARRLTFEYGNTFLMVAGLLNYLMMLDAFDIAAGRKS